jgi:phage baseplate assembly protein V
MAQIEDRVLTPVLRRLDNMLARGVLRGTRDAGGVQNMQVGLLEGETADKVERVQVYGLSSVPPNGGDCVVAFLQGNRDHGMILSVNDRASRPRNLGIGEVVLYNDKNVKVHLDTDGTVTMTTENATVKMTKDGDVSIEGAKTVALKGTDGITIESPKIDIKGDIELDGNLHATGSVTWDG